MKIDFEGHRIIIQKETIWLTTTESNLLKLLYEQKNNVVSYQDIADRIYKVEADELLKGLIRKHIALLRKKIKKCITIKTVKSVGYIIEEEEITEFAEVVNVKKKQEVEDDAQEGFKFDYVEEILPF